MREQLLEAHREIEIREKEIREAEEILGRWVEERNRLLQENQRLESINRDKTVENDKKAYENSKLMIKLALAYSELDRRLTPVR